MAKARTHHKRRKSSKTHATSKSGRKYRKHPKTGKWVLVRGHNVRGHLAKNPRRKGKHRVKKHHVKGHRAHSPHRSAAARKGHRTRRRAYRGPSR